MKEAGKVSTELRLSQLKIVELEKDHCRQMAALKEMEVNRLRVALE